MLRFSASRVMVICCALGTLDATPQLAAQEPSQQPADKSAAAASWQAPIETALQKSMTVEFTETPLTDVVAFLKAQTGQAVFLEAKALENIGVGVDTPVTCKLVDISLRNVLKDVLRPWNLRFVLRDGALVITSPEEADKVFQEDVFDATELVRPAGMVDLVRCNSDALIDAIVSTVDPLSWSVVGGPGSIESFRGRLVVSQHPDVRDRIRRWLVAYRKAKQLAEECVDKAPPVTSVPNEIEDAVTAEIYRALERPITLQFHETPLEDVVQYLGQVTKVNIAIDLHALNNIGVGTDMPISFDASSMQLRHSLRHILSPIGCTWCVRDQVLLLTSVEESETELVTMAYPVADLLGRTEGADLFGNPRRPATIEQLVELLTTTIAPQTWAAVGGSGNVAHCAPIDVLIVLQSAQVHEQVTNLLRLLRQNPAWTPTAAAVDKTSLRNETTRLVVYGVPTPLNAVVATEGRKPPIPEEQLVQLIAELIEPESWKSRQDVYLRAVAGRLLIRHTESVQRQVQDLLARLGVAVEPLSASEGTMSLGHMGGDIGPGF